MEIGLVTPLGQFQWVHSDDPIICPNCRTVFEQSGNRYWLRQLKNNAWAIDQFLCKTCQMPILFLVPGVVLSPSRADKPAVIKWKEDDRQLIFPKRNYTLSPEIPEPYRSDYLEAASIFEATPKASAALSRRCLQQFLRDELKVKPDDLYNEISEVIEKKLLPSRIADELHALRQAGNIGVHPFREKDTGKIIPVEPEDAEYTLVVLEAIFDHHFVQTQRLIERRKKIEEKYKSGKK